MTSATARAKPFGLYRLAIPSAAVCGSARLLYGEYVRITGCLAWSKRLSRWISTRMCAPPTVGTCTTVYSMSAADAVWAAGTASAPAMRASGRTARNERIRPCSTPGRGVLSGGDGLQRGRHPECPDHPPPGPLGSDAQHEQHAADEPVGPPVVRRDRHVDRHQHRVQHDEPAPAALRRRDDHVGQQD